MTAIRQSTARTILVGPVLDADGVAKTDEVVANIRITKNGTVGSANGSTTLAHDHAGKYQLAMNAADPDTVGVLEVSLNSGTNDMPVCRLNVVEEAVYDVLYAASATGWSTHDAAAVWSAGGRALSTPGDYKANLSTLESRLTAARANLLDNIPAGTMPTQEMVLAIQNNTRVRVIVPPAIERPDSSSVTYRLWLYLYDMAGNMESPDSLPTVAAENNIGTDRSSNLSAVTNTSTGVYYVDYTVASNHAIEGLRFEWTIVEGGVTRKHGAAALVVDTTAVDFTAADRTLLQDVPSTSEFEARTLPTADYFDPANDDVAVVTLVGTLTTYTGNTLQTGDVTTAIDDLANATDGLGVLKTLIDAIPTEDVYHADIDLSIDEANTQDEYTVTWFKNAARVTSGITTPTIQVVKRVDGTDLVASTALTQIGSTGSYKKDEGTNRVTAGEAVLIIVSATIDSGARSFARVVSRDSSA